MSNSSKKKLTNIKKKKLKSKKEIQQDIDEEILRIINKELEEEERKKKDKTKIQVQSNNALVIYDPLFALSQKVKVKNDASGLQVVAVPSTTKHLFGTSGTRFNRLQDLDTFMEFASSFGSFNYQMFMFLVNMILTGADVTLNVTSELVAPLVVQGYRLTKRAMGFLLNVYSIVFQNWVAGAAIYAVMTAFPSLLYDGITYLLGKTITSYLLYPFSSLKIETPAMFRLDSPASLVGMLTVGSIVQFHPAVHFISGSVSDVIFRLLGIPVKFADQTISSAMYNKWIDGGWKSISLYLGSILAGSAMLWLVSPELLYLWQISPLPQLFYDIQSYICYSISSPVFTILKQFFRAITVSQIAVGKVIGAEFPMFQNLIHGLFSILTGGPITSTIETIFFNLGDYFRGTSIYNVLNGTVDIESEIPIGSVNGAFVPDIYKSFLDSWYRRFDPGIILFLNNLLYEKGQTPKSNSFLFTILQKLSYMDPSGNATRLLSGISDYYSLKHVSTVQEKAKMKDKSEADSESFYIALAQLYNITRPTWYYSQMANWSAFQRMSAVFRVISAAANSVLGSIIPSYATIAAFVWGFFLIGISRWFIVSRSSFDRTLFAKLSKLFAILSNVFEIISDREFEIQTLKDAMRESNYEELKLLEKAIAMKDKAQIYVEYVNACINIRGMIIRLASVSPDKEEDEVIVRKTLPSFANSLVNYTTQIQLLQNNISPRSDDQPEVEKEIEKIILKAEKVAI